MLWNNEVFRYLLTGLSSLRIDYKVDQQYRPTPLCLHPHIDQSLPLRINALFTVEIRQSVQGLPDNYGDKWFSRLDDALQPQDKPGRQFICLLSIWWHNTNVVPNSELLLRLSKGNARVEIPASFFFRSVANCSEVLIMHAQPFDFDACATFWLWAHGMVWWLTKRSFRGAKSAQILCIIHSKRIQNMHTSFAVEPH